MIGDKPVLAVITARSGSKGLPGKNLLPFRGRPLIAWSIEAAAASRHIDRVIVSSDGEEIIRVCTELGCEAPFRREAGLAGDEASSVDVVLDALDRVPGYRTVVLLQPTSPLRTAADIDGALELMERSHAPSCVSVCPASSHPWLTFAPDRQGRLEPFVRPPDGASFRRQDLPPAWTLNGAVYAADAAWLRRERTFLLPGQTEAWMMPTERSADIDTLEDFQAAERAGG
jgi:CMP-N,N'-diacetyllegionaminic acid synthase